MVAEVRGDEHQLRPANGVISSVLGKKISPSTCWRWYTKGIACPDGTRRRLQVWYVGRTPHTTKAAVIEWLTSVTEIRLEKYKFRVGIDDVSPSELRAAGLSES